MWRVYQYLALIEASCVAAVHSDDVLSTPPDDILDGVAEVAREARAILFDGFYDHL
jgi:hypothetical protein